MNNKFQHYLTIACIVAMTIYALFKMIFFIPATMLFIILGVLLVVDCIYTFIYFSNHIIDQFEDISKRYPWTNTTYLLQIKSKRKALESLGIDTSKFSNRDIRDMQY